MATERQPVAGQQIPAWAPAYEQAAWLDVEHKDLQVEGDPETAEAFAAA